MFFFLLLDNVFVYNLTKMGRMYDHMKQSNKTFDYHDMKHQIIAVSFLGVLIDSSNHID